MVEDNEQMKNLTAIHEAAHTVTAYLSQFHFLIGNVSLTSDDSGETFVTLSKKKISKSKKPLTNGITKDHDVVKDAAIIYYSGFEAENILCKEKSIVSDISFSKNDYNHIDLLIKDAGADKIDKETLKAEANGIVKKNWTAINQVAVMLLSAGKNSVDVVDIIELLDKIYGNNSW